MRFAFALAGIMLGTGCAHLGPASPVAPDSHIAYLARGADYWQVWVMRPDGTGQQQVTRSDYEKTRVSWFPDGEHLLVNALDGRLFRVNRSTGAEQEIPLELRATTDAVVSPRGDTIAFSLSTAGAIDDNEIWTVRSDGSQLEKQTRMPWLQHAPEWSADGRSLYFLSGRGDDSHDIWRLDLETKSREQLTAGTLYHFDVAVSASADLAFSSNRSGHYDLWIQRADASTAVQLTNDGPLDAGPSFGPDGRSLVFHSTRSGSLELWRMDELEGEEHSMVQLTDHSDGARDAVWWHPPTVEP